METMYLAALQMVPGIGNARIKALIAHFGCARQAWLAERRDLFLSPGMDSILGERLVSLRGKLDPEALGAAWSKQGIGVCALTDLEYPALLRNTYHPPYVLYYRGTLPAAKDLVAVVGSRKASAYGKNVAESLGAGLAGAGIGVVSGAARGIDTAAHTGALTQGQGYTVAVLGCGVDVVYPAESGKLLKEIAERGCVLSEYSPGTPARPGQFPARNRIISGMARGVAVVEAAERSGALITADFALEEGRDVFAVPGSIFSDNSKGTHRLIKQGAKLLDDVEDILEEYGMGNDDRKKNKSVDQMPGVEQLSLLPSTQAEFTPEEAAIYQLLRTDTALAMEEIVLSSDLTPAKASYVLLQLELRGWIVNDGGKRYLRATKGVNR